MPDNTTPKPERGGTRWFKSALLGGVATYAGQHFGPVLVFGGIDLLGGFAALMLTDAAISGVAAFLWSRGNFYDLKGTQTPTGHKGASRLGTFDEIRPELSREPCGPYWGAVEGKGIISPLGTHALIVGTQGSGKSAAWGVTNIFTLSQGGESIFVNDMKSELACITKAMLEKEGYEVRTLNFSGINANIIGPSDTYNPFNLIADNFWREDGLRDVSDDIHESTMFMSPEESGDNNNAKYWSEGSRDILKFTKLMGILINGYSFTPGDAHHFVSSRQRVYDHALWVLGKLETGEPELSYPSDTTLH